MGAPGYESWFVSARDPGSPRALWIRHTRHRPRQGPESAALWCTVIDRDLGKRPAVLKQVFSAFPPETAAGPGQFRGRTRLRLSVALAEDDRVAVAYADPRGGTRTVTHAALASVELIMQRPGNRELTLTSSRAAYEYGARQPVPRIVPESLPEG